MWSSDFQGTCITLQQTTHCCYTDVHVTKFKLLICCFVVEWKSQEHMSKGTHWTHPRKQKYGMVWYYKSIWLDLGGTTSFYRGRSAPLLTSTTPTPSWVLGFPCQLCKDEKHSCVGSGKEETTYTDQLKIFHWFQAYSQLSCSTVEMFQHGKTAMQ